jgi:hydroxymethylglutaryl-CoA lyase
MPEHVRITDVSPRDGLQNEAGFIPTRDKVRLIELLATSGVDEVEVTSFVSSRWVPQLGDAPEVCALVGQVAGGPQFSVLVPNDIGMRAAILAHRKRGEQLLKKLSVFTAASESFCRKNINSSIAESLVRFKPVIEGAHESGLRVRGYVSCAIACPFEGMIAPAAVARIAGQLAESGVDEIDLGDTIGAGTPQTIGAMLEAVRTEVGDSWWNRERMTLHVHDTFGRAGECVKAALDLGVRSFDGSVAGLGGCPYASAPGKRAPGNISTELLVRTVEDEGYKTGVDRAALERAAEFARQIVLRARAGGTMPT